VVVARSGATTQKIIVSQKVPGEFAIAPLVIELRRIPKGAKGKNIELLRCFEVETQDEVDVILGQLRVERMDRAGERVDPQTLKIERFGCNLQPLDDLVLSRFLVRP